MKELQHLTALTSLNLSQCFGITAAGLQDLKYLTALTSLDLSHCPEVKDAGLKELKPLTCLTSLNLVGCWEITAAGLKELVEHISTLTYRDISYPANITHESMSRAGLTADR